jgi:hypothetical protein
METPTKLFQKAVYSIIHDKNSFVRAEWIYIFFHFDYWPNAYFSEDENRITSESHSFKGIVTAIWPVRKKM